MTKQRPKHQNKDIEAFMRIVEEHGWVISKGKKYYRAKCACERMHMKSIHLTPSGSMYLTNLEGWFKRQSCWKEGK